MYYSTLTHAQDTHRSLTSQTFGTAGPGVDGSIVTSGTTSAAMIEG